jgi:hypothetical protein
MIQTLEDDRVGDGEVVGNTHYGAIDVHTGSDGDMEEYTVPMEQGASILLFHGPSRRAGQVMVEASYRGCSIEEYVGKGIVMGRRLEVSRLLK